jgi:hypothetical protein
VLCIVVTAYGARNQEFHTFIKFSCGLFVPIRGLGGEAEGGDMNGVPEKGSPNFWRDVHSISRHGFEGRGLHEWEPNERKHKARSVYSLGEEDANVYF